MEVVRWVYFGSGDFSTLKLFTVEVVYRKEEDGIHMVTNPRYITRDNQQGVFQRNASMSFKTLSELRTWLGKTIGNVVGEYYTNGRIMTALY